MTVQNLIVKNIASGNGSTTQWPFTFACPVDHPEYIKVYIKGASGKATATNDFSVNMTTKYVTYPVAGNVLASGEKIIIARELPLHQILNLVNQGPFYAEDLEVTYDELVMMVQQLNEQLQRSLKVGIDIDQEREIDITIPVPTNASNYGIRITKNGFELVRDPQDAYDAAVAQNTAAIATMNSIRDENVQTTTGLKNEAEAAKTAAQNAASVAEGYRDNCRQIAGTDYDNAVKVLGRISEAEQTTVAKAKEATDSADIATSYATQLSTATNALSNASNTLANVTSQITTATSVSIPAFDDSLSLTNAVPRASAVGELSKKLDGISYMFSFDSNKKGYWKNTANGLELVVGGTFLYDKIEIPSTLESITFEMRQNLGTTIMYCCFADAEGKFVSDSSHNIGAVTVSIPKTAKYICLSYYGEQYSSGYTFNFVKYINEYDLQKYNESLEKTIEENRELISSIGEPNTINKVYLSSSNIVSGYWNYANAIITDNATFSSVINLINVNGGEKLVLHNWKTLTLGNNILAFCAYNDNGQPYAGTSGRFNYSDGTASSDGQTYTFTLPVNCKKIGLSIVFAGDVTRETAYAEVGDVCITAFSNNTQNLLKTNEGLTVADMYQKGASVKSYSKKPCIICAGQSNAQGRCASSTLPSYIVFPMNDCHLCKDTNGEFSTLNSSNYSYNGTWGFDLVTYYYCTQIANNEIYVIKKAESGASIDEHNTVVDKHWTAEYEKLQSLDNSLLYTLEKMIRACISNNNNEFDVRAVIWHQGEGDSYKISEIASKKYYINLKNMVSYLRGVAGNKTLPFICGTISKVSEQYDSRVNKAIKQLAEEDKYFYAIDLDNAQLQDNLHFNSVWAEYFGKCVHDKLIEAGVISGSKINPSEPS